MQTFQKIALLALPLLARVACEEPPASPTKKIDNRPEAFYSSPNEAFQDLLNALPEESLHVALNSLAHFRDGVFESDRHGVERVHNEDPPLATRLIIAAVQDLKKRQNPAPSNGTSQSTPAPGSSSEAPAPASSSPAPAPGSSFPAPAPGSSSPAPAPASSSPAPAPPANSAVVVPVPIQTTDAQGKPTVVSSEILSQPTASVAVPVTRTNAAGQTEVATETKPAVIFTASDGSLTTSAVEFAPTPGEVLTRTDSRGSTFLTTYTPDGGKVSSILLLTTTGPDGKPSVITSYAFVDPAQATGTNGNASPTRSSTGKPGLQSGAAVRNRAVEAAVMGGAVGGAFALFM